MKKYKVLIIGAGKIGAFYDSPLQPEILTHCHGFTANENFQVVGIYDKDSSQSQKAAMLWDIPWIEHLETVWATPPDVVCLCVPDSFHYEYLKLLADKEIKIIFAEKPIARTKKEIAKLEVLYQGNSCKLLVNYTRRFLPEMKAIRDDILSGEFGQLIAGTVYYGKGLIHNASHAIDLLSYFFCEEIKVVSVFQKIDDFYKEDMTYSAMLSIQNQGPVCLHGVDSRQYTIFEVDLLFEKKRVRIAESGRWIQEYKPQEDDIYGGYAMLRKTDEYTTQIHKAMALAIQHIQEILEEKTEPVCTLTEGIKTMDVCFRIMEMET